jgi:hypothetical protein
LAVVAASCTDHGNPQQSDRIRQVSFHAFSVKVIRAIYPSSGTHCVIDNGFLFNNKRELSIKISGGPNGPREDE